MGRAPSSGYCQTCRQRRIKCDKTRPGCERCQRSGLLCRGYQVALRVQIYQGPNLPDQKGGGQLAAKNAAVLDSPSYGLDLVPFQDQLAFSHFLASHPIAEYWRPLMVIPGNQTQAADRSHAAGSLAVALGLMGLKMREATIQRKGMQLYSQTLQHVQNAVAVGDKLELVKLLPTVITLSMYSVAVDNLPIPVHHAGLADIIRYCGPESFQAEPCLTTYKLCRATLICKSLTQGRRIFLEGEKWKKVPWLGTAKTSMDQLLDIIADLPGLAQDMASGKAPRSLAEELDVRIQQLSSWRKKWNIDNFRIPDMLAGPEDEDEGALTPTVTGFSSFSQALELMTFNAGLLYALTTKQELLRRHTTVYESDADITGSIFSRRIGVETLRIAPFYLDNFATDHGRALTVFAPRSLGIIHCLIGRSCPDLEMRLSTMLGGIAGVWNDLWEKGGSPLQKIKPL